MFRTALLLSALCSPRGGESLARGVRPPGAAMRPARAPLARARVDLLAARDAGDDGELCAATLPTPSWQPPAREQMLERLERDEFDVLVIGGGATGAGVAMDAATRGLRVALIERGDYSSGTSSRSTKLIHGGLRYLAQAFQSKIPPRSILDLIIHLRFEPDYLRIVAADLAERAWMIQSAPFMTRALPMMVPLYRWWEVPLFWIVGTLYDLIAGAGRGVPPSRIVTVEEARFQVPLLRPEDPDGNRLVGGLVIYDGQQNDARMGLHIVLTAIQAGASCANYVQVEGLLDASGVPFAGDGSGDGGAIGGARVRDRRTGKTFHVRAKQVVNACGVFSDAVRQMAQPTAEPMMVPSYGTHVILPDYATSAQMGMVWFTKDGRVLYLLPWEGSAVAGTTDAPGEISFEPRSSDGEVDFILGECNRVVREPLRRDAVRSAWAGIRPLVRKPGAAAGDTKALSRDHVVERLGTAPDALVTIAGGKWTTYRKMAEDAVDVCVAHNPALSHARPCGTLERKLVGSDETGEICDGSFDRLIVTLRDDVGVEADVARHLKFNYGTRALQLVEMARAEPHRFCADDRSGGRARLRRLHAQFPHVDAEVAFACRFEFAQTPSDVLAQRTRLCFLDADAALSVLPRVVEIMAEEKGWTEAHAAQEAEQARVFLEATMRAPRDTIPAAPAGVAVPQAAAV
ncbi:hypothetical protein KFE25_003046 [Diacronema lutheri]|uniref:Glycerol-3-phosphate dehydrogenase n=1 Tax=Diacronema lutheri TaxID=2081491 RepID=A0A8J6C4Q3_DIALT|nr:hypothetical protein KFE25_003046 [Diacronema lutheri]